MLLLGMIGTITMFGVYLMYTSQGESQILTIKPNKQTKVIQRFGAPIANKRVVENWVSNIIPEIYNLNYSEFVVQPGDFTSPYYNRVVKYFTKESYQTGFFDSYPNSNLIQDMIENKYIVSAYVLQPAKIQKWGYIGDAYYWVVEVPIHITKINAQNGGNKVEQNKMVSVTVKNIPARPSEIIMDDLDDPTIADRIASLPRNTIKFLASFKDLILTGSMKKDEVNQCRSTQDKSCSYTVLAIEGFEQNNIQPGLFDPSVGST